MTQKDPLFQPLTLGNLTLKNRIMSTSHAIAYQVDGKPKERYQSYHEEKAIGGLALTMFGGSSNIDFDSASVFGQLYVGNDDIIPYLQAFADRIHQHDTALMCQITHLGRRSSDRGDWWLPTIGPSRSRERLHRSFCKSMDTHDIKRVQQAYVDAAIRCQQGGLDGIELMAGSHLPGQFLAGNTNQRTDGYGGDYIGRSRFLREILIMIREAVGADFLVGLRLPCEESDGGIGLEESTQLGHELSSQGLVNFLNVYFGRMDAEHTLADNHLPGMATPAAPFLEKAGAFKQAVQVPVFHATRVSDVATARYAIREGIIDMVAMTRAHIADPHIANKIRHGQEHRIRPCVGATLCSTDFRVCIHNAATGAEQTLTHRITTDSEKPQKAVVIGGGPAGMEAARVLALRGHQVVLFEAQSQLGGQVRLAAQVPWRKDLLGIADWLAAEIEHLGVEIRYNTYAETEGIHTEHPDIVIVATGGLPDIDDALGAQHCMTSWDVLSGGSVTGESVLVFDETGRHAGCGVADYLVDQGKQVELITVDGAFGRELTETDIIVQRRRFAEREVIVSEDLECVEVEQEPSDDKPSLRVTLRHILTGKIHYRWVDAVVLEKGTLPMDELFNELVEGSVNKGVTDIDALLASKPQPSAGKEGYQLYRCGDAISSRGIHEAIKDSLRLCLPM